MRRRDFAGDCPRRCWVPPAIGLRIGDEAANIALALFPSGRRSLTSLSVSKTTSKTKKMGTRLRLALRQNRAALSFVTVWTAIGAVVFARVSGLSAADAVLAATCLTKAPDAWGSVYQAFTQVVVFGAIASVVVTNVTRKYNPEATSRALAAQADAHVVVIGFSHLGQRVREIAANAAKPVVVVEEDASKVAALVADEEPLVVGSPRERGVLAAAGLAKAKVVVIATDDLETAAVASRLVRETNDACELVVSCPDEDVGAVLAKTYRARAVSTTRLAAEFIRSQATKGRAKKALVVGDNELAERVAASLADKEIGVVRAADVTDGREASGVDLVVICDDDLGKNLIRVDRIRDHDRRVKILCRAFHEDAAVVLTREPFSCIVLSTSRHAAEALARAGVLREVGIDDVAPSPLHATVAAR